MCLTEPAPPPPFWRRTDAVTVLLISDNGTVLWRHALQNIQNDCHQWLSHSFTKHKNLFSDPAGELIALPQTLYSWFKLIFPLVGLK